MYLELLFVSFGLDFLTAFSNGAKRKVILIILIILFLFSNWVLFRPAKSS